MAVWQSPIYKVSKRVKLFKQTQFFGQHINSQELFVNMSKAMAKAQKSRKKIQNKFKSTVVNKSKNITDAK